MVFIFSALFLVIGFVVGILVGRKNKKGVEAAVAAAKVELAAAKAELANLRTRG